MLAIKPWLETTGMPAEETAFLKPPAAPYLVFSVEEDCDGADFKLLTASRAVSVELYANDRRSSKAAEQTVEALLVARAIPYRRTRAYIATERYFQTVYDFELIEKMEG